MEPVPTIMTIMKNVIHEIRYSGNKLTIIKSKIINFINNIKNMDKNQDFETFLNDSKNLELNVAVDFRRFLPFIYTAILYTIACGIHYYSFFEESQSYTNNTILKQYYAIGLILSIPILLICIRRIVVQPMNRRQLLFVLFFDTISNTNLIFYFIISIISLVALSGYVFLYCLMLLDFINLSKYAQNTFRSIIDPYIPLLNVAMMFIIVILIFGIFSLVQFGSMEPMLTGKVIDDDNAATCDSILLYFNIIYIIF